MLPQVLRAAEPPIPFDCIKQEEGQYVVTFPGAFQMVVNIGSNCAEAINVCLLEWEEFADFPEWYVFGGMYWYVLGARYWVAWEDATIRK